MIRRSWTEGRAAATTNGGRRYAVPRSVDRDRRGSGRRDLAEDREADESRREQDVGRRLRHCRRRRYDDLAVPDLEDIAPGHVAVQRVRVERVRASVEEGAVDCRSGELEGSVGSSRAVRE